MDNSPPIEEPKKSLRSILIKWPVTEIARQLTLINFDTFSKIEPKECLNQNWNKKDGSAPNVRKMIDDFNRIGFWVQTTILKGDDVSRRQARIEMFIKLADELFKMNNFHSCFAVLSGLNSSAIHRLRKTWNVSIIVR